MQRKTRVKITKRIMNWARTAYRKVERRRRLGERRKQGPLLFAVIGWGITIGLVVTAAYLVIYHWVLSPKVEPVADSTVLSMALTIAAGTGGLVLLVVNYRKQHVLEESHFVERFSAAAAQLGHEDVAIRLAGVYAMTGVAERTRHRGQIQQCIDVLCGYMRLPYEPNMVEPHQISVVIKRPIQDAANSAQEKCYKYRQNDEVVRQAIVTVVVARLQRRTRYEWTPYSFNFSGAYFDDADFLGATFMGESTRFDGATFMGESTRFDGATFMGESTRFDGATFMGETTSFEGSVFYGESTRFDGATFMGETTSFEGTEFYGESTRFDGATFMGETTSFNGTYFEGDSTSFSKAVFSGRIIDFCSPKGWDPAPTFDWDDLSSGISKPTNVKPNDWPPIVK